jgi:hypothetical protein
MLHPYFDSTGNSRWLWGTVESTDPARVVFEIRADPVWDATLTARVLNYFTILRLASLYSKHAATIMADLRSRLTQFSSPITRRQYLFEEYDTRCRIDSNSPQTATYHALASSGWYCESGFELKG